MTAPTSMQASALQVLADRLRPSHLIKGGVTARKSEAEHLIAMLKDAAETLRGVK